MESAKKKAPKLSPKEKKLLAIQKRKEYREKNKDKLKEYNNNYYIKNKEKIHSNRKRFIFCKYCNKKITYESSFLHYRCDKHLVCKELYLLKNPEDSEDPENPEDVEID
jgi:hypothetical protein